MRMHVLRLIKPSFARIVNSEGHSYLIEFVLTAYLSTVNAGLKKHFRAILSRLEQKFLSFVRSEGTIVWGSNSLDFSASLSPSGLCLKHIGSTHG